MGLTKLLAVGRSVRSLTEEPARYKMTQQNLLPTFGGARGTEARAVVDLSPAMEATPKTGMAAPARTTAVVGPAGAGRVEAGHDKAAAFLEATKQLRPFGRGTWFKNPFSRTASRKPEHLPVQTELSLDSVRPVRNDLNDSEVELGQAPGQAGVSPRIPKGPTAMPVPVVADGLWQRLKTRLFGAANAD